MTYAIAVARLVFGVLLAGHALFLFRMAVSIDRAAEDATQRDRLATGVAEARFPGTPLTLRAIGWILIGGFWGSCAVGPPALGLGSSFVPLALGLAMIVAHFVAARGLRAGLSVAFGIVVSAALVSELVPRPGFNVNTVALVIHLLAAAVWLGHMFYWSLVAGPSLKRLPDRELGDRLRRLSREGGGLGWPALGILGLTGAFFLVSRGLTPADLVSARVLSSTFGRALDAKLLLVLAMVGFQAVFGHREAPRAIYANMLVALLVLALAVWLTGA